VEKDGRRPAKRTPKEKPSAASKAVDLISRSIHSRKELKRKLLQRDYAPEEVDRTLGLVESHNLLNEVRDAEGAARSLVSRGYWGLAIRARLGQRGFSRSAVEKALDNLENDHSVAEQLERLIPSRIPADEKGQRRLASKLVRRGIPVSMVRRRLKQLPAEALEQIEQEAASAADGGGADE